MSFVKFSAALAAAALSLSSASAAALGNVVTLNQILDLTQAQTYTDADFQGWVNTPAFNGDFEIELAEGDSLNFTIDFLDDQTLTVTGLTFIWAFLFADQNSDVLGTGFFQFLDQDGNAIFESPPKTSIEGNVHFGQSFSTNDFIPVIDSSIMGATIGNGVPVGGTPFGTITFAGVRYVGQVNDYLDPSVTSRRYHTPGLLFGVSAPTVPEPESWAMMIAGLGMAGAALRRRATRVRFAG